MAKQLPPDFRPPIKSTWRDPIGVKLTDRRITNRIKQGWYGEVAKLQQLARSTNKAVRKNAREKLKRFEGVAIKAKRTMPIRKANIIDFV